MQGVRRDTNTMSVFRYDWHFKMTGFLFTERNARAGWSSAAFLMVWKGASEGWWQADGLSMISAPSNLPVAYLKISDMVVWLQFTVYLPKIVGLMKQAETGSGRWGGKKSSSSVQAFMELVLRAGGCWKLTPDKRSLKNTKDLSWMDQ